MIPRKVQNLSMSKEVQKLRRNKYEVFNLFFTSYTSNLLKLIKPSMSIHDLFIFPAMLWYFKLFEQDVYGMV